MTLAAQKQFERRSNARLPLRNRWLIVRARLRTSWPEVWVDVLYLVAGPVLWTLFLVLIVVWMLGVVSTYTLGGFIHLLLVVAIIVLLIQLIQGKRVL